MTNDRWQELIQPYLQEYAPSLIAAFTDYWRQKNPNGKKELWEMQKVFDMGRRLSTWKRNDDAWSWRQGQRRLPDPAPQVREGSSNLRPVDEIFQEKLGYIPD